MCYICMIYIDNNCETQFHYEWNSGPKSYHSQDGQPWGLDGQVVRLLDVGPPQALEYISHQWLCRELYIAGER